MDLIPEKKEGVLNNITKERSGKENELSPEEKKQYIRSKREYIRAKRKYLGINLKSITKCINQEKGEGYGNPAIFEADTSSVEEEIKKKFDLPSLCETNSNQKYQQHQINEKYLIYKNNKRLRQNYSKQELPTYKNEVKLNMLNPYYLYKQQYMTSNNRIINNTTNTTNIITIGSKRSLWY